VLKTNGVVANVRLDRGHHVVRLILVEEMLTAEHEVHLVIQVEELVLAEHDMH
jgi:hypothetical protein